MIKHLTLEDVLLLCRKLGGLKIRDLGLLDSAVHRPHSGFGGHEAYPTIPLKAAALLHSIAKNHALFDGNKRLAWTACQAFLVSNGHRSGLRHEEAASFMLTVAGGEMDVEDIAAGLKVIKD